MGKWSHFGEHIFQMGGKKPPTRICFWSQKTVIVLWILWMPDNFFRFAKSQKKTLQFPQISLVFQGITVAQWSNLITMSSLVVPSNPLVDCIRIFLKMTWMEFPYKWIMISFPRYSRMPRNYGRVLKLQTPKSSRLFSKVLTYPLQRNFSTRWFCFPPRWDMWVSCGVSLETSEVSIDGICLEFTEIKHRAS